MQVWPGAVLLQGQALTDAYFLVSSGIRAAARNGYPTARFEGIRCAIRDADVSPQRHDDMDQGASGEDSPTDDETFIDTGEAAVLLGVSRRTAQRLARKGLGRQVAGTWLLDKGLVIAEAAARKEHNDPT